MSKIKNTVLGKNTVKGIVNILFKVPPGKEKEYERKIYLMAEAMDLKILGLTQQVIDGIIDRMATLPPTLKGQGKRSK